MTVKENRVAAANGNPAKTSNDKTKPPKNQESAGADVRALAIATHPWPWIKALRGSALPPGAKHVGTTLQAHYINADYGGIAWCSQATLAAACGIHPKTAGKWVRRLVDAGFLMPRAKPFGGTCRYVLTMPAGTVLECDAPNCSGSTPIEDANCSRSTPPIVADRLPQKESIDSSNLLTYPSNQNLLTAVGTPQNANGGKKNVSKKDSGDEEKKQSKKDSNHGEESEEIVALELPPAPYPPWPDGMVRQGLDDESALNWIGLSAMRYLGYDYNCNEGTLRVDGRYVDEYIMSFVPPDILAPLIEKCRRGSGTYRVSRLSNSAVAQVLVRLRIPLRDGNPGGTWDEVAPVV